MKRGGCMPGTNPKRCQPIVHRSIGGSNSSSSSVATATNAAAASSSSNASETVNTDDDTVRYQVLYYKSSRKVHKCRGVSKADGTLTVSRSTGTVRLVGCGGNGENGDDDSDNAENSKETQVILYSGMNPAIHKRCDDLQVDETVRLGNYEVDIVAALQLQQPTTQHPRQHPLAGAAPAPQGRLVSRRPGLLPAKRPLPDTCARWSSKHSSKAPPQSNATVSHARENPLIVSGMTAGEAANPSPAPGPADAAARKRTVFRRPLQSLSAKATGLPRSAPLSSQALQRPTGSTGRPVQSIVAAEGATGVSQSGKRTAPATASLHKRNDPGDDDGTGGDATWDDVTKRMPVKVATVLRPHQVVAVQFLWRSLKEGGAILADEPGLGKTLTTIACIAALHREHRNKHFCVVCPSSLVNNWVKEFDHWLGKQGQPKRVPLLRGDTTFNSSSMKSFLHSKVGQVVIMSFELFRLHSHHFASPSSTQQQCGAAGAGQCQDRFALLVVDEGHRLKSTTGSLTLTSLEQLPADARLLLSATPIQNNLGELYTLANFCRPGILGESIAEFRRRFEKPIAASNTNQAAQRELEQILSTFMLRRLQTDVLKSMLPPRMEALIFCRPSQRQCDLYRQVVGAATSSSTSVDVLSALTSLRKVCSHPFLHEGTTEAEKLDSVGSSDVELSGKLVILQGLLRSMRNPSVDGSSSSPPSADKVVIVSNFTSTLSLVESLLLKPSGYSYLRLDGSTSPETRQSLVDAFNKQSKIFCFLLSSKAGGCGLNLIGANRLVLLDPSWNPADDIQAMGRIYRQGQQRPTSIYRLFTSGTIEEVMYQRQTSKNTISGGVLDKKAGLAFSRDEINECMALKAGCDCDTRRKAMGKGWPPYAGLNSLLDQGVEDTPLADVATTLGDVVGFVRVVPDGASDEGMAVEVLGGTGSGSTNVDLDAYNSDSEEEFEFAAKPNACNKLDSDASAHDEECGSDASNSEAEFE